MHARGSDTTVVRPFAWILLIVLLTAAAGYLTAEYAKRKSRREALAALEACRGEELKTLDAAQVNALHVHLSNLGVHHNHLHPWYVWDFSTEGRPTGYLLFQADTTGKFEMHPGYTGITLTVMDHDGKPVCETYLSTGWRCYLRGAKLDSEIEGGRPLVVLTTGLGGGPGPDVRTQYYALIGERFELVRLEDSDGNATRNRYYVKHFRCGPPLAERTEAEWVADLTSADRYRVLMALTWLGGTHWDLHLNDGVAADDRQVEDVAHVHLVRRVRAHPKVILLLRDMVRSDNPWLRQAASLAAHPEDDHF